MRALAFYCFFMLGVGLTVKRAVWGLVWIVLIYFFEPTYWGAPSFFQPVAWLTVLLLACIFIQTPFGEIRWPRSFFLFLLLVACYYVSTQHAVASYQVAMDYTVTVFKLSLMIFIVCNVLKTERDIYLFLGACIVGVIYITKTAVVSQIVHQRDRVDNMGVAFGGANGYSLIIMMLTPFVFEMLLKSKGWKLKTVFLGILMIFILGFLAAKSRASFLVIVFYLMYYLFTSNMKMKFRYLGFLAVGGALFAYLAPASYWERMFTIVDNEGEESAESRKGTWALAWNLWLANPVFGIGPYNFHLISNRYGFFAHRSEGGLVVHNTYLQTLVDGGAQALLLWMAVIALNLWRLYRMKDAPGVNMILRNAIMLGLIGKYMGLAFASRIHSEVQYWFIGVAEFMYYRYHKDGPAVHAVRNAASRLVPRRRARGAPPGAAPPRAVSDTSVPAAAAAATPPAAPAGAASPKPPAAPPGPAPRSGGGPAGSRVSGTAP